MSDWQELDLAIYHERFEFSKLDTFIKNKSLQIQIKSLHKTLFNILEIRQK